MMILNKWMVNKQRYLQAVAQQAELMSVPLKHLMSIQQYLLNRFANMVTGESFIDKVREIDKYGFKFQFLKLNGELLIIHKDYFQSCGISISE